MAGVDVGGGGRKRSANADVNMVPFIDLLLVTVAFLLITAVWIAGAVAAVLALGHRARATPHGRAGLLAAGAAFLVLSGGRWAPPRTVFTSAAERSPVAPWPPGLAS